MWTKAGGGGCILGEEFWLGGVLLNTCRGHHHVTRVMIRSVEAAGTLAPVGNE